MVDEPFFPVTARIEYIVFIFLAALVIFNIFLVRLRRTSLGKIGWKRTEFIWLAVASISLLGAVSEARILFAKNQLEGAIDSVRFHYRMVSSYVDVYSNEGAVCRTFVRSEFSPPEKEFKRLQRLYDEVCLWFSDLRKAIPREMAAPLAVLPVAGLPASPKIPDDLRDLREIRQGFIDAVEQYNKRVAAVTSLRRAAERSTIERAFISVIPILLALAFALRFTKVMGEIRLESKPPDRDRPAGH